MNWRRALIAIIAGVPILAILAWGLTRDPNSIPSPLPGRAAPSFALQVFAPGEGALKRRVGDTVSLAAHRGEVVVLNFWASWCLECRTEHAFLSDAARHYAGKPVSFLGVLYNDVEKAGIDWITEMGGAAYPAVSDPAARTAINYGLYGVPETFFIDASGRVAFKQTGPVSPAVLRQKIDSLLAGASRGSDTARAADPDLQPRAKRSR